MRDGIRLAVAAGLALAFAAPTSGFGQGEDVSDQSAEVKTGEDAPGAASMEPVQALADDPGYENSDAHQAWLDSIWNTP
jgi:hypothetical protein